MKKGAFIVLLSLFSLFALFLFDLAEHFDGKMHVVFCDVGQGDGIYIRTADRTDILIDGGPGKSILNCLNHNMPFWDRTIELVLLTHNDSDHINGQYEAIDRYNLIHYATQIGALGDEKGKKLQDLLAEKKTSAKVLKSGNRIDIKGKTKIFTVWPNFNQSHLASSSPDMREEEKNDMSLVLILEYESFRVLLTGDTKTELFQDNMELNDIDVIKVPHHGAATSLNKDFMSKVNFDLAVISVGNNNRYKHPSPATLKLLSGKRLLRTDLNGEIEIITDGKVWEVTSKN